MVAQLLARYSAPSLYTSYVLIRTRASQLANSFQGFFVFCGLQAFLHMRESRRGAISLS
jgi:hypothetical protein